MAKSQELTITKYKIDRCGYYKPYAKGSPHLFGNIDGMLQSLLSWSTGKNLSETQTYEGSEDQLATYLFDIYTHKSEYVICTWNESFAGNGQVLSVSPTELVGTKEVSGVDLPEGFIAGYPAYFWFRPLKNEFFTIQLAGALNGRINLNSYLQAYVKKFDSRHVVTTQDLADTQDEVGEADADALLQGYRKKVGAKIYTLEEAAGMFESSLVRKKGGTKSELNSKLKNIYKIVRKETIKTNIKTEEGNIVRRLLGGIGVKKVVDDYAVYDYKIKYEVDFHPSEKEFEQIINNWTPDPKSKWDDIGFKLSGQNSIIWLSSSIDREKYDVNIVQTSEGIVDLPSLIIELQKLKIK